MRGVFNFMDLKLGMNTRTLPLKLSIEDKVATTTESIKFFWLNFLGHLTQTNNSNTSLLLFTVIFSLFLHFDKNKRLQRRPEGILWWTALLRGCQTATKADLPIILKLLLAERALFLRSNTADHIPTADSPVLQHLVGESIKNADTDHASRLSVLLFDGVQSSVWTDAGIEERDAARIKTGREQRL